jgi:hypothetical protein
MFSGRILNGFIVRDFQEILNSGNPELFEL